MSVEFKMLVALFVLLLFLVGLFLAGRWLARRFSKGGPSSIASVSVTRAGMVWVAVQVLLMVGIVILYNLYPTSSAARWLSTPSGFSAAVLGFVVLCSLVGAFLGRRGTTLIKRG